VKTSGIDWTTLPFRILGWAVLVFLAAPMLVVFPVSITNNRWLSLPSGGISFSHYADVLNSTDWLSAIGQSLLIAVLTMIAALAIGTAAAIAAWRLHGHWAIGPLRAIVLLPVIVPAVVSALGMYRVWVDFGLFDTLLGTVIAHTILAIPFVFLTVSAALAGVDRRIEQASRTLGAGAFRTAWEVLVPAARPGILAGAVFAFITSWDEIVVTMFVTARHVFTLPRKIFQDIHDNLDPAMAAVSAIMILVTVAVAVVLLRRDLRRTPVSADGG
jgi:putative spermidine/putrescine transport system permease protein